LEEAIQDLKAESAADGSQCNAANVQSTLRNVPTPSRGKNGLARKDSAELNSSPVGSNAVLAPWDLKPAEAVANGQSAYREMLQMRGQQAMQRSRLRTTLPTPPPASPARLMPIVEMQGADHSTYSSHAAAPASPWMGTCSLPTGAFFMDASTRQQALPQVPPLPVPSVLEQLCGPGADGTASMSTVSPNMPFPQGTPPVTPHSSTTTAACESPCTPQELMHTLMGSGAFAFDDQQIAEALKAAAPCVYDD